MENSKLIKALKTLNKKEFRRFTEFVESPFYNKNKNVIRLITYLGSYYPQFKSSNLNEVTIFENVFPDVKFDYFKIRNLFSDLLQLFNKYLKIIAYENSSIEPEIKLLNELHDRKLDVLYEQTDKQISKELNSSKIKGEYYFELMMKLNRINTSHYKFDRAKYTFDSIQTEFDSFLQYSIVGLLQHYSKMLHNKNHGNVNYNMEMFDQVMEYISDKTFEDIPSCQIYKQTILVELNKDEKDYRKLLELKEKYEDHIYPYDLYSVLLVMNSFAVYRIKLGDENYYKDRFFSLKEIIERKFFAEDILYPNFITTFTSACMAGEYEWAAAFMEEFSGGITPIEEQQNTLNFCEAFLAYRKGDYEKSLELFAKTNFRLFLFKVMVKSYMLRMYYEKDLHEQTLTAVDAFKHYLKSENMISEDQKTVHYEFLKNITLLSNIKLETNKKKKQLELMTAEKSINKMKSNPMGIKTWLLLKAAQLK